MTEAERLVGKHRRNGLLIDSNLFLLLLVGSTREQRIPRFDRTQKYTVRDFRLLREFVSQFETVVTTPHVLTEVSNLASLKGRELLAVRTRFRQIVDRTEELYEQSRNIMADAAFAKLGLADAAIRVAANRPLLVVTDDLALYHYLSTSGLDAINFNHVRPL
jgi:hypothetical protein